MATNRVSLQELERVLPARQVSKLAVKYGVDAHNQYRLPGITVFACLLDSIMNHGVTTQRLLEEIHFQRTGNHADHSSFGQRLITTPAAFFEAIYRDVHARLAPQASAAEQRALGAPGRCDGRHPVVQAVALGAEGRHPQRQRNPAAGQDRAEPGGRRGSPVAAHL